MQRQVRQGEGKRSEGERAERGGVKLDRELMLWAGWVVLLHAALARVHCDWVAVLGPWAPP